MDFYMILQSILDEKNLSIPDAARLSGLSDSTIRTILARKNKSVSLEVAFKLSTGLGVPIDCLNGETNKPAAETGDELNESAIELVKKLQQLDQESLELLIAHAELLLKHRHENEDYSVHPG